MFIIFDVDLFILCYKPLLWFWFIGLFPKGIHFFFVFLALSRCSVLVFFFFLPVPIYLAYGFEACGKHVFLCHDLC